jgi:hypothetical protein
MEEENFKDSVKSYYENRFGINNPFRQDNIGRKAFYPSGPFGKGYYIPDGAKETQIQNLRQASGGISMAVSAIGIFLGSLINPLVWIFVFIILLALWVWYRTAMRKILNGLDVIEIGSENYSPPNFDKRYRWLIVALLICGIVGGIGDIYNRGFSVIDLILAAGCAFMLVSYSYISWIRKSELS